ncbi:hypothetical protein HID58_042937 [Brassica napus]|uniref:Uncharacterized protein n=1 Tax=Brassica napus TaxID=3708 RepID=A0ABQ8BF54_BRANA|nr:hypothetical protein HID58_042937 [Brassica napus]
MSFNVQAALCFPLGEPLSAFSRRHSMTRRLFLNLPCHGHADGKVYQGTWPGKTVEHVFSGFFYSPLLQMSRGRRSSSVPGAWAGFLSWNNPVKFDKYSKALYPPCDQIRMGGWRFDATEKEYCL